MEKKFLVADKTGHGASVTHTSKSLAQFFGDEEDYYGETLRSWITGAEVGDAFNSRTLTITRIQ